MVGYPETMEELQMFTTKLSVSSRRPRPTYNLVAPLALAVLGVIAASTSCAREPAAAGRGILAHSRFASAVSVRELRTI